MARHQFSLRSLFAVMTLMAFLFAAGPSLHLISPSFDALATMLLIVVAPAAFSTLLILATLPFAYRQAVTEIDRQHTDGATSPPPDLRDRSESTSTINKWRQAMLAIAVPLLLACLGAGIGATIGLDWQALSPRPSLVKGVFGAAIGLFAGMAYMAVLPAPERPGRSGRADAQDDCIPL